MNSARVGNNPVLYKKKSTQRLAEINTSNPIDNLIKQQTVKLQQGKSQTFGQLA